MNLFFDRHQEEQLLLREMVRTILALHHLHLTFSLEEGVRACQIVASHYPCPARDTFQLLLSMSGDNKAVLVDFLTAIADVGRETPVNMVDATRTMYLHPW